MEKRRPETRAWQGEHVEWDEGLFAFLDDLEGRAEAVVTPPPAAYEAVERVTIS